MQRCLRSHTLRLARLQAAAHRATQTRFRHTDAPSVRNGYRKSSIDNNSQKQWEKKLRDLRQEKDGNQVATVDSIGEDEKAARWANFFLDTEGTRKGWQQGIIWLLKEDAEQAIDMMVKTIDLDIPTEWIADSLQISAFRFNKQENDAGCSKLVESLKVLTQRPLVFKSNIVHLLLPYISLGEVQELWSYIAGGKVKLKFWAYCQMARHFAANDDIPRAVDALISALDHKMGGRVLMETLMYVIQCLNTRPDGYLESLRLCKNLEAFGISIDVNMANFLLRNAMENKKYETMVDMYHLLFRTIEPNYATTAILLQAHKHGPSTSLPLADIIESAVKHQTFYDNVNVGRHLLYSAIRQYLEEPATAWPKICDLYGQMFETASLIQLGIPVEESKRERSEPGAIAIMLRAYLRLYAHDELQDTDPVDVYKAWYKLAQSGDQPYREMASNDRTYNAFLVEFVRSQQTLINATDVIKDMQAPFPGNTKPTIWSWNIFLLGFQMHDKPQLAEQVLEYMLKQGMKPNQVTWNQLVSDFADAQDLNGVLRTLDRAADAGAQMDEDLDRGLSRFKDQKKLHAALRRRPDLDFSDELKSGIEARLHDDNNEAESSEMSRN